jgi:hypothetical protein
MGSLQIKCTEPGQATLARLVRLAPPGSPGTPGKHRCTTAPLHRSAPKSMKHTKWTPRNETRHYRPVSDRHWMERPSALQSRVGISRSSDSYTSIRYCVGGKQIIICFIITATIPSLAFSVPPNLGPPYLHRLEKRNPQKNQAPHGKCGSPRPTTRLRKSKHPVRMNRSERFPARWEPNWETRLSASEILGPSSFRR